MNMKCKTTRTEGMKKMKFAKDQNGLNLYHGTIVIDTTDLWYEQYRVIGMNGVNFVIVERYNDGAILEKYTKDLRVKTLLYGSDVPDYFVKEWNETFIDEDIEKYLFENDERVLKYLNS